MKKVRFLDFIISKKVFEFKHPKGHYSLKFPRGWRMKRINSSEQLFIEINTNHGLVINAYPIIEKSLDMILKLHKAKCLEDEFKPKMEKFKEFNLVSWAYNFDKENTIELKRIYYNSTTILDVSYCIKNNITDDQIESEIEKEQLLFQTLLLRE